jgi:CRP-like cAMP-binding protein
VEETAVQTQTHAPLTNRILASLSQADFTHIAPLLKNATHEQGVVLQETGDEVEHIHFPHSGMISLLAVLKDGKAIETATVGREGVVGAMAGLGLHTALARAVVQVPMVGSQIAAAPFRKIVQQSNELRDLIVKYNEVLLAQVQTTAACNALHHVEARLSRWILQTRDRTDTDRVPLTQEFMSEMLGVRRTSVSEVASKLQNAGLIRYSRGVIEIVDRLALERRSCECYASIREKAAQILPNIHGS